MKMTGVFTLAALRYWLLVFPRVRRELRRWRHRGAQIPDQMLRELALEALEKRANMEGAAAFAVMAPRRHRASVVRAIVAFQTIYNYTDLLAEQPGVESVANARRLHEALFSALDLEAERPDYYLHHSQGGDGGYLRELADACGTAFARLPGYESVVPLAHEATARIVGFQSLSVGEALGLERWARTILPFHKRLEWWEAAAAAGSSLSVHALIAAAAGSPEQVEAHALAIEDAYYPYIDALHSLLDSLVDEDEDAATGQLSLLGGYRSEEEALTRMTWLAGQAIDRARALPKGRWHAALVVAMACSYLSAPETRLTASSLLMAWEVREELGGLARAALLVFKVKHAAERLARRFTAIATPRQPPAADGHLDGGKRGVDARAA